MMTETIISIICDYVPRTSFGNLLLLAKSVSQTVERTKCYTLNRFLVEEYGHITEHITSLGLWNVFLEGLNLSPTDKSGIYKTFRNMNIRREKIYVFIIRNTRKYESFEQFRTIFKDIEEHKESNDCLCAIYKALLSYYAEQKSSMCMGERVNYTTHLIRFMDIFIQQSLALANPHLCVPVMQNPKLIKTIVFKCNELPGEMKLYDDSAYNENIKIINDVRPRAIQWHLQVNEHFRHGRPVFHGPRGGKYFLDNQGNKKYLPRV